MDVPPSRYRVVERGRRLEVIDTRKSERSPVGAPRPAAARRRTPPMLRSLGSRDGTGFTTSPLYDDKGPRTLRLDHAATARLKQLRFAIAVGVAAAVALAFLAWWTVPVALAVLANPRARAGLRGAATRYLDGFDRATRGSAADG